MRAEHYKGRKISSGKKEEGFFFFTTGDISRTRNGGKDIEWDDRHCGCVRAVASFRDDDILSLFAGRERVALLRSRHTRICKTSCRRFIPARPIKHKDHARIVQPDVTGARCSSRSPFDGRISDRPACLSPSRHGVPVSSHDLRTIVQPAISAFLKVKELVRLLNKAKQYLLRGSAGLKTGIINTGECRVWIDLIHPWQS